MFPPGLVTPLHCLYNCVIEFLPRASLPVGQLYSLSGPKRKVIDEYMNTILQGACILTKLDICIVYHLVNICDRNEWKTVFNTPSGHEYLFIPFGFTPGVFQALVGAIFCDFLQQFVAVYLDDIIFFSKLERDQVGHVCQMFHRLLQHWLYVSSTRRHFLLGIYNFYLSDPDGSREEQRHSELASAI